MPSIRRLRTARCAPPPAGASSLPGAVALTRLRQDERRRSYREKQAKEELLKFRKERPKIQQQFSDLKRELAEVSQEEWATLPEAADIGKKVTKKRRADRFTAAPDSLLFSAMNSMTALHQSASFAAPARPPPSRPARPPPLRARPRRTRVRPPHTRAPAPHTQAPAPHTRAPAQRTRAPAPRCRVTAAAS